MGKILLFPTLHKLLDYVREHCILDGNNEEVGLVRSCTNVVRRLTAYAFSQHLGMFHRTAENGEYVVSSLVQSQSQVGCQTSCSY